MSYLPKIRKAGCIAAAAVLAMTIGVGAARQPSASLASSPVVHYSMTQEEGNPMTGLEVVKAMKLGWNLGNTFDAPEGEMTWGNPMTTKEMLQLVKDMGFETIRIPISWGRHVSAAPEYTIDETYMQRIDTVVNQALDAGLYVLINSHHDNDIYMPREDNEEQGVAYLSAIWKQIAEHFKDADYHLIFQTMNEPRVVGSSYEWSIDASKPECRAALGVVNALNQAALDAIRSTGGKNADRFVVISPYAGNSGAAMNKYFVLPEDSAEGKLIVSIHAYTPYNLCLNMNSSDSTFGKKKQSEVNSLMKNLNYFFIKKGIPVVIDEMGCLNKNNPEGRYDWAKGYVAAAQEYDIPCIWWDNGQINSSGENFGLINRRTLALYEESATVYQGLMDGLAAE